MNSSPMLPRRTVYACNWHGSHQLGLALATTEDAALLHSMQQAAFKPILDHYHDIKTNPATEPVTRVRERIEAPDSDYYIITVDGAWAGKQFMGNAVGWEPVGGLRVARIDEGRYRISPIYVIPEYQRMGIAREAFAIMEKLYPSARSWELDTIAQEHHLCRFYESLGFTRTGVTRDIAPGMTLVYYRRRVPAPPHSPSFQ